MFAVIRIKGSVGVKKDTEYTLELLRLHRKNHCVLLKEDGNVKGMLQKVKDYVSWGEIDNEILKKLIEKRARKIGDEKITDEEAKHILTGIHAGKNLQSLNIKPVFRLTPPSKGFKKSIKQHYPNGELGYRGKEINDLLKRMI